MAGADQVKSEVLKCVLAEVQDGDPSADADVCVICLDQISEQATAKPCSHANFDYLCLVSWLDLQAFCPLCKSEIRAVAYQDKDGKEVIYDVANIPSGKRLSRTTPPFLRRQHRHRARWQGGESSTIDAALRRRRQVYQHQLYSLHVGTNRISAYRDIQPSDFVASPILVSRARAWIRRELRVFRYLEEGGASTLPPTSGSSSSTSTTTRPLGRPTMRTASNAEFLLEYVVAILKTVDIRAASGHAEELVTDFLGRDTARLFLHELNSFLRSPYESPETWDRYVQYPEIPREAMASDSVEVTTNPRKRHCVRDNRPADFAPEYTQSEDDHQFQPRRRYLDRYAPD